jgi:hypothetical protein
MASLQRAAVAPMARPAAVGVCLPMRRPVPRSAVVSNAAKGEREQRAFFFEGQEGEGREKAAAAIGGKPSSLSL